MRKVNYNGKEYKIPLSHEDLHPDDMVRKLVCLSVDCGGMSCGICFWEYDNFKNHPPEIKKTYVKKFLDGEE